MSTCAGPDVTITTQATDETVSLGRRLGAQLEAGDVVALSGPLGSGKTYLTKGIALGLGVTDSRAVRSPTFILVSEYHGRLTLYHVDAYRLTGPTDLTALGSDDFLFSDGVTVVEWAERVKQALPEELLWVECRHAGEHTRTFRFSAGSERFRDVVKRLCSPTTDVQ
ncbi:MAG TPA: tRNA (adenosine(37)-N6)-threonylcarbamoyltransferase complex ATPase subunit type 1 TsaE [Planctomycetota bacterium]|nr:tRNA (adenosine(37)-N6)-threonylcarbamoyltransferase complex ATPase subunit type 1 TsaE [Planctomycetota bacterium]